MYTLTSAKSILAFQMIITLHCVTESEYMLHINICTYIHTHTRTYICMYMYIN